MAFINDHQVIIRKIVQQAERTCALGASVEKTAIVFDSTAVAQLADHLEIKCGSFLNAFSLKVFLLPVEIFHLGKKFVLDIPDNGL